MKKKVLITSYLVLLSFLFLNGNTRTWFCPDYQAGLGPTPDLEAEYAEFLNVKSNDRMDFRFWFKQGWNLCGSAFYYDEEWRFEVLNGQSVFLSDLSMEDEIKNQVKLGWNACSARLHDLLSEKKPNEIKRMIVAPNLFQWLFIAGVLVGIIVAVLCGTISWVKKLWGRRIGGRPSTSEK